MSVCHGFQSRATASGEVLLLMHGDREAGRLRLHRPHPGLCLILGLDLVESAAVETAGQSLLQELRRREPQVQLEALCWDRASEAPLEQCLRQAGFLLKEEKRYVERSLVQGLPAPAADSFTYTPLALCGRDAFIFVLAELEEPPAHLSALEHAREGFAELEAMAGEALDAETWQLALLDGKAAGLVLPQAFPDNPEEGTLFFVGLRPDYRGRGLGHVIHARGLAILAEKGVKRYLGSTATSNHAMCRVFARNGCKELGLRRSYVPPAR